MFGYLTAISDGQRSQLEALFIVAVTTLMINYSEVLCIYEHPANILL